MADQATQPTKEKEKAPAFTIQMAEAGFSMNVKMLDKFGQEVMLTFRAPLASHAGTLINHYNQQVEALINAGWAPLTNGARAQGQGGNQPAQVEGIPNCEYHGPMKRSNHGGFYCPKKMGDGTYCKSKSA